MLGNDVAASAGFDCSVCGMEKVHTEDAVALAMMRELNPDSFRVRPLMKVLLKSGVWLVRSNERWPGRSPYAETMESDSTVPQEFYDSEISSWSRTSSQPDTLTPTLRRARGCESRRSNITQIQLLRGSRDTDIHKPISL